MKNAPSTSTDALHVQRNFPTETEMFKELWTIIHSQASQQLNQLKYSNVELQACPEDPVVINHCMGVPKNSVLLDLEAVRYLIRNRNTFKNILSKATLPEEEIIIICSGTVFHSKENNDYGVMAYLYKPGSPTIDSAFLLEIDPDHTKNIYRLIYRKDNAEIAA